MGNNWNFFIILMHLLVGVGLCSVILNHHIHTTFAAAGALLLLMHLQVLCCMWFVQGYRCHLLQQLQPLLVIIYLTIYLLLSYHKKLRFMIPRVPRNHLNWLCLGHAIRFLLTLIKSGLAGPITLQFGPAWPVLLSKFWFIFTQPDPFSPAQPTLAQLILYHLTYSILLRCSRYLLISLAHVIPVTTSLALACFHYLSCLEMIMLENIIPL